jgi:hypothetical protein
LDFDLRDEAVTVDIVSHRLLDSLRPALTFLHGLVKLNVTLGNLTIGIGVGRYEESSDCLVVCLLGRTRLNVLQKGLLQCLPVNRREERLLRQRRSRA